jgi:hypothetical protein
MKHVTFVHYTQKVVDLLQRGANTTITSQHRSEVDAPIANSSILPHSDWLASTVSFNLTTAKISKYSAMIGLLRLDEASQSE